MRFFIGVLWATPPALLIWSGIVWLCWRALVPEG